MLTKIINYSASILGILLILSIIGFIWCPKTYDIYFIKSIGTIIFLLGIDLIITKFTE